MPDAGVGPKEAALAEVLSQLPITAAGNGAERKYQLLNDRRKNGLIMSKFQMSHKIWK